MAERKRALVPVLRIKKGDNLKTIYVKARRAFSAEDLQVFTQIEKGVPARSILAKLEALDREQRPNRRKKSKNGRR
jgi:hypothetical protein